MSMVPESYSCSVCHSHNVKLWRRYQSLPVVLLCKNCVAAEENISPDQIDSNGTVADIDGLRSYSIGWHVPAILTEEEDSYWGYTSVPEDRIEWWRGLNNEGSIIQRG